MRVALGGGALSDNEAGDAAPGLDGPCDGVPGNTDSCDRRGVSRSGCATRGLREIGFLEE